MLLFFVTIIEKFCDAQPEPKGGAPILFATRRGIESVTSPFSNREIWANRSISDLKPSQDSKISAPSKSPVTDRQESRFPPGLPSAVFAKDSAWPSTFLPGSAQNIECDVSSRKQSPKKFLPGATTTPVRRTELKQFHRGKPSRISATRAKIAEHSLLLSPRNFIGLQDRDCRSVRLTVSAQK
jgi:hypothetical protein